MAPLMLHRPRELLVDVLALSKLPVVLVVDVLALSKLPVLDVPLESLKDLPACNSGQTCASDAGPSTLGNPSPHTEQSMYFPSEQEQNYSLLSMGPNYSLLLPDTGQEQKYSLSMGPKYSLLLHNAEQEQKYCFCSASTAFVQPAQVHATLPGMPFSGPTTSLLAAHAKQQRLLSHFFGSP